MSKVFLYGLLISIILSNTYASSQTKTLQNNNMSNVVMLQQDKNRNTGIQSLKQRAVINSNIPNVSLNKNAINASISDTIINKTDNNIIDNKTSVNSFQTGIGQSTNMSNFSGNIQNNNNITNINVEQDNKNIQKNNDVTENKIIKTFRRENSVNLQRIEAKSPSVEDKNILQNLENKMNKIDNKISIFQQQQEELNMQRQEENEKINKLFNSIYKAEIVVVKHNDNTSTVTTRNKIDTNKLPISEQNDYDPTMVPINIINP